MIAALEHYTFEVCRDVSQKILVKAMPEVGREGVETTI